MVDLVKIRRKKAESRKQKAEETPALPPQQPGNPATEQPPAAEPRDRETAQPSESKLDRFRETAGKRRAAEAAKAEETKPGEQLELLTFIIAAEHYAVDIEHIIEIVKPRGVTRIPNADPTVVGILSLRGTIVTLVDVRRKLRHPPAASGSADTRIVVVEHQREMIGFLVDRVLRVVKAGAADIEPHPVVHSGELDESIRGVFRAGGALTILLDLDKLLVEKQKSEIRNQKSGMTPFLLSAFCLLLSAFRSWT